MEFATSRILPFLLIFLSTVSQAWAEAESTSQAVGRFLVSPQVAGTLLVLGIVFGFLSIVTPGTGFAEVLCFGTFTLIFAGRYLVGGEIWIPMGLLLAGGVFAAVEFFLMPGTAVFGLLSLISFGGLSILLMDSPKTGLAIFSASIVLCLASLALMMKFMPKFVMTRKFMVLEPPVSENTPLDGLGSGDPLVQPGDVGEVVTTLRPVGAALFGTERLEVVSEGEFLSKGAKVQVLRVEGSRVYVRSC